ncbi:MAG: type I-E CRISPR-associated protein Cas6/Cse3/CasE [Armatimonadetes bacterium]|nr:type I-E CRISPR-associated protein Cas6/Cse3/CasE [Armatimonadota bacterium]
MFLSQVILEGRTARVHNLVADLYRQHQFVYSAFPDKSDREESGEERRPSVLYRLETTDGGARFVFLVQSEEEPDWMGCGERHIGVICASHIKEVDPHFSDGQRLRFRLRANPTQMRLVAPTERKGYKRVGLYKEEEQRDWLARCGERLGFRTESVSIIPKGVLTGRKPASQEGARGNAVQCLMADFDGSLTVTNAETFAETYRTGAGRGKAWGCGLLSVARL